jgi:hypothetical protein
MKKAIILMLGILVLFMASCDVEVKPSSDSELQKKTEAVLQEANREVGIPAIVNFQEKKNLKWIYELCDQEDLICYAYLFNEMQGTVGQYLGECIGYGIPYSTQFSNPEKLIDVTDFGVRSYQSNDGLIIQQAEPNGLFKPTGLSATWLIMIDPTTKKPRPVYIEPQIIVSPFKLK